MKEDFIKLIIVSILAITWAIWFVFALNGFKWN